MQNIRLSREDVAVRNRTAAEGHLMAGVAATGMKTASENKILESLTNWASFRGPIQSWALIILWILLDTASETCPPKGSQMWSYGFTQDVRTGSFIPDTQREASGNRCYDD